ncbi:MAG TPA: hypothetical protein VME86_13885 [Acidobacteriaceae bacterium]|nr:hypothetical protein [Acidobacteriaceae bacterium]
MAAAAAFFAVLFVPLPSHAATTTSAGHLKLVSANALLTTRLDSKNARLGERLTAKLTGNVKAADAMELPKGTVLLGKVAHVQPSINNGPSRISVVFNQARLRNGHVIPIKATLLGAYPTSSWNSYDYTGVGGPYIGLHSHYISYDQKVDQEPGTLSHVAMRSAVQSSVSGVFSSKDRNIDLRSGTQLQFAIAPKTKNG